MPSCVQTPVLTDAHFLSSGAQVPLTFDHAIERGYRKHLNGTSFRDPFRITVPPGQQTGWLDVGGWMDTLQHGSWSISCDALAATFAPENATKCTHWVKKLCNASNTTECLPCVEAVAQRPAATCPPGCVERGKCNARLVEAACKPPPSGQEVACFAVVKKLYSHTGAFNYTQCLEFMKGQTPCPRQCSVGSRCQDRWFEDACHHFAPPPPPPKPPPPPQVIGSVHCQIEVGALLFVIVNQSRWC